MKRNNTNNKPVRARTSFLSKEGLSTIRPKAATKAMSKRSLQRPGLTTPSVYATERRKMVVRKILRKKGGALPYP